MLNRKGRIVIKQPRISRIRALYFSATGTTEKVVHTLAKQLSEALKAAVTYFNFTPISARDQIQVFSADELAIIGLPVYAGRVPNVLLPYLTQKLSASRTPTIPVVLYGNRNYDDALMELKQLLTDRGFLPFAAATMVGEHAFSTVLAANRPDASDLEKLAAFARSIAEQLQAQPGLSPVSVPGCDPIRPYYTPRDHCGNPVNILKVKPVTDPARCTQCGLCSQLCPMGSISPENAAEIAGVCIKCCACVKRCPNSAKSFVDEKYLYHQHELEAEFSRRAEPEFYF